MHHTYKHTDNLPPSPQVWGLKLQHPGQNPLPPWVQFLVGKDLVGIHYFPPILYGRDLVELPLFLYNIGR